MPSDPSAPGIPGAVVAVFVIIGSLFVVGLIVAIWTTIWKSIVLRRAGLNPMVAAEQLEAQLYQNLRAGTPVAAATPGMAWAVARATP